ncbi:hypothetical protein JCM8097_005547 [Rhodosporidiobolus ruineniae]
MAAPSTSSASTSSSSRSPFLPALKLPIEAIPHLIPWQHIVVEFAPAASPDLRRLWPALNSLPPDPVPYWDDWLNRWHNIFVKEVWTALEADDSLDWAHLTWYEHELVAGKPEFSFVREQWEYEAALLRWRIKERWIRLYEP